MRSVLIRYVIVRTTLTAVNKSRKKLISQTIIKSEITCDPVN